MIHRSPFPEVEIPDVALVDYVFAHADRYEQKPALIDGDTGRTITYGELRRLIRALARGLIDRGLQKGDVVAIYSPNVPEYPIVFYAAVIAGAIVTTINPQYTVAELSHQLRDSSARFLVTVPKLLKTAREGAALAGVERVFTMGQSRRQPSIAALYDFEGPPRRAPIDAGDVVALPYSSGTTGLAKGVMLTHRSIVANLQQTTAVEQIHPREVLIATVPFYHIYGMMMVMSQGLRSGATLVTLAEFKAKRFIDIIERYGVTTAYLVPPLVRTLATDPYVSKKDLSCLRDVVASAAPLPERIARACADRVGCSVRQVYGMTEASPVTHVTPRNRPRLNAVGFALPNTEYRIVDVGRRRDVAPGKLGEVWIRGPQLMKGYLNNPEATTAMIDAQGWLHTGDIGFADRDGYLYVVDRAKELVKFRGLHYGEHELLRSMVEDIAARRHAHERSNFQALLLDSVRESVVATDSRHRVTFWNRGAEALFGYPAADAVGRRVDALIIPPAIDVKGRWHAELAEVGRAGKWQGQALRRRRDGSTFWTDLVVSMVTDSNGAPSGFIAIHRDITELRRNQEMLRESREQLRNLASRLMVVREEERSTIARELHDELGQALTRLKIDLSWLTGSLPGDLKTPRAMSMAALVDKMVEHVQNISAQLRPAILDDLGLEAALESHVEDFASWNRCRYRVELALSDLKPRRDRDTAVFRIVQEALTNVARHSHATMVIVRAGVDSGTLRVVIEDNGDGIPDHRLASADALGLLGMRERAEGVGGSLVIRRRRPHGTIVNINVPVDDVRRLDERATATVA